MTFRRDAPFTFAMAPPAERATVTQSSPTVWHVSQGDAMVIALAEINRWFPTALYDQRACGASNVTAQPGQPTCGAHREHLVIVGRVEYERIGVGYGRGVGGVKQICAI